MGNAGQANYAASKGGVISFSKTVAKELASRNVRCNAIAPGLILHERLAAFYPPAHVEIDRQNLLSPRAGRAGDVANAVLFLASELAAFVNGHVLPVDGGRHLRR